MKKVILCAALMLGAALGRGDTTTSRFKLIQPAIGSTGWGVKTNNDWAIVDSTAAGQFVDNAFTGANTFAGLSTFNGSSIFNGGINLVGTLTLGSPLSTTYGGTGQNWSSIAAGRIPYFSGTGTMATSVAGSSGNLFMSGGTSAPFWSTGLTYSTSTSIMANTGTISIGSGTLAAGYNFLGHTTVGISYDNASTGGMNFWTGAGNIAAELLDTGLYVNVTGSASSPALKVMATNTGLFGVSDGLGSAFLGVSAQGVQSATFTATGLNVSSVTTNAFSLTGGSPGAGKVLASDANGVGTWQTPSGGITGGGIADYFSVWNGASSLSTTTADGSVMKTDGSGGLEVYNTVTPGTTFFFDWGRGIGINQKPSSVSSNKELLRASGNTPGNGSNDALDIIVANQGHGSNRLIASCEGSATQTTSYLNAFGQGQPGSWWSGGPVNANSASIELQNGTAGQLFYEFGGSAHSYFENETSGADWSFGHGFPPTEDFLINASSNVSRNNFSVIGSLFTTGAVRMANFGAGSATFDASGNISSVSDITVKNVVGKFNRGLDALMPIQPINFKWKQGNPDHMETTHVYTGFSAQNVAGTVPEAAWKDNRGLYSLQDRALMAVMVNAIKELSAKVDALEAELKKKKTGGR